MGKGDSPRPVSKGYGAEIERIFGKRCVHNRKPEECRVCLERDQTEAAPEEEICEACGEVHGPHKRR